MMLNSVDGQARRARPGQTGDSITLRYQYGGGRRRRIPNSASPPRRH
jgi:hypothetical protein